MSAKKLIKKTELSEITGISRGSATKACAGKLKPAMVGKLIDLNHQLVIAFLKKHDDRKIKKNEKPESEQKQSKKKRETKKPAPPGPDPRSYRPPIDDLEGLGNITLNELAEQFGTAPQFKTHLEARKLLEEVKLKKLIRETKAGLLIPRDMVKTHVFGFIDAMNKRLLIDTPRTLAQRVFALAKAGGSIEEGELRVREVISAQIKNAKRVIDKILEDKTNV